VHFPSVALWASVGLAACQSSAVVDAPDGGDDAGPSAVSCMPGFGQSFIFSQFGLLPPGQGFDLNGDGKIDNALGGLGAYVNSALQHNVDTGYSLLLFDFHGLPQPLADANGFQLNFFAGLDADMPPDPSNNLGGMGRFLVPIQQFDVNCHPTTVFTNTSLKSGAITANTAFFDVVVQAVGTLKCSDGRLSAAFSSDEKTLSGQMGGVASVCALSELSTPVGQGTFLDLIVSQFQLQPDIDSDHDGLDHIVGNGQVVTGCVSGSGVTIDGHECACDPRIQDGYSVGLFTNAVSATIVGVAGSP
jgi:hypothetical protein